MSTITVSVLRSRLDAFGRGKLRAIIHREVARAGLVGEAKSKQTITERLSMRSGRLRSSIRSKVEQDSTGTTLHLAAGDQRIPYAATQEYGATIAPKRAKYLAIPIGEAKTAAGDVRGKYARGPRSVPGLIFIRAKSGKLFLAERGSGESLNFVFFLTRGPVRVPGVGFLRAGVRAAQQSAAKRIPREIQRAAEGQGVTGGD